MMEIEQFVVRLRGEVRELQSLLNYLENRELVLRDDYAYVHAKLKDTMQRLGELAQLSSQRGGGLALRAEWLN